MKKRNALMILILAILCILPSCETENTHTVRFLVDNTVISTSEIQNGSYVAIPPIPEKENCIFRFWSSNGKDSFDFSKPITSNLDITAVYTKVQIPKSLTVFKDGELIGTGKITYEKNKIIYSEYGLNDEKPSRVLTTIHDENTILQNSEEHFNDSKSNYLKTCERTYENNLLLSQTTTLTQNGETTVLLEEYTYADNGRIERINTKLNGKPLNETTYEYIGESEGKYKETIKAKNIQTGDETITTYHYMNNVITGYESMSPYARRYTSIDYPDGNFDKQVQTVYEYDTESEYYKHIETNMYISEWDENRWHKLADISIIQTAEGKTTSTRYDWSPEVQDFLILYPYAAISVSQQTGYEYEEVDGTSITKTQSTIVWEFEDTF